MFKSIVNDDYISINYIEGYQMGIAEISRIDSGEWYFNRLNVPVTMRNKGVATSLMKQLIIEADKKGITIVCDINPYGDLNKKQLQEFYKKFGFVEHDIYDLIRYKKN